MKRIIAYFLCFLLSHIAVTAQTDSIASEHQLKEVEVKATNGNKSRYRVDNVENIGQQQLIRAACCNLGESFTTNPSVDVSYSDAATGAKQIKLLGLSGTYVQMLTENIPNLRGASIPYALGYVPGPWMQSIQVSKGASSVKNGYESTTGQINIEFLKPQGIDGIRANAYLDSKQKYELNADGSIHLNDRLSTSLLLHFENRQMGHDSNGDGFMDMPRQKQINLMHRWAYVSPKWISQLSFRILADRRNSGQMCEEAPYTISVDANRAEFQWKNGFTLSADHNESIALMLHGSSQKNENRYGLNAYDVRQLNGYAQLMYERDMNDMHNIAVGASLNHDGFKEMVSADHIKHNENTSGVYAQYTLKLKDALTFMAGLRYDYSNLWGSFVTPRVHIKYSPSDVFTLRASSGKGYRTAHPLAENSHLMASGRSFPYAGYTDLFREEAWNHGISASMNIPVCGKNLELNAEYYYTNFLKQLVVNIDGQGFDQPYVSFSNLDGKSYSHTIQLDATYPFFKGFTATGAFRINDARTTYEGVLHRRPLTSFYKGLLTLSYKTPLELWHFDVTGQLNGKGELYDHSEYPAFLQLQAQVTRDFRHFSIYLGGENLTNYRMPHPIINAQDPFSQLFDATQVWGPTDGAMAYIGIRIKFEKL